MTSDADDPALKAYLSDREALIAIACRQVESRAVAEELVQESWLRWQNRDYRHKPAVPMFRRIVNNLARDWGRRRRVEHAYLGTLPEEEALALDAERIVVARQELRRIVEALEELPPRVVTAFRMNRVEGLTYAEIAKRLDTVPSRAHGYVVKALAHVTLRLMA